MGCQSRLGVSGLPCSLASLSAWSSADLGGFVIHVLGAGGEDGHESRIGAEGVEAGPGFGGGASPGGVDEADGDVVFAECLLQIAREEVGDGGEVLWRFRECSGTIRLRL